MTQKCFYATNKITKILVKKARNSLYKKDTVFVNIYNKLEKKIFQSQKHCLLEPRLLKKKTLFVQRYLVLVDLFKHCKLIQHTLAFQQGRPLTQRFVLCFVLNMEFKKSKKKKKRKNKTINDYAKLIQSTKKQYRRLAPENELLKKKKKKIEDKQFTTNLINHRKKKKKKT